MRLYSSYLLPAGADGCDPSSIRSPDPQGHVLGSRSCSCYLGGNVSHSIFWGTLTVHVYVLHVWICSVLIYSICIHLHITGGILFEISLWISSHDPQNVAWRPMSQNSSFTGTMWQVQVYSNLTRLHNKNSLLFYS